MPPVTFHDVIAGLFAVGLLVALVLLTVLNRAIPDFLTGAFGVAVGYVFRGGVQVANDMRHRNNRSP